MDLEVYQMHGMGKPRRRKYEKTDCALKDKPRRAVD